MLIVILTAVPRTFPVAVGGIVCHAVSHAEQRLIRECLKCCSDAGNFGKPIIVLKVGFVDLYAQQACKHFQIHLGTIALGNVENIGDIAIDGKCVFLAYGIG